MRRSINTIMPLYRLFLAIELSSTIKQALAQHQATLQANKLNVSWVQPQWMHLTLHFLGDTDTALLPEIDQALAPICAEQSPFELQLSQTGGFPNLRRPSVLWVGVAGALKQLNTLYQAIGTALTELELPVETRPYHPHLTLAYVRRNVARPDQARIGELFAAQPAPPPLRWPVDRVVLFRSELLPGGPRYTPLYTWPFGHSAA